MSTVNYKSFPKGTIAYPTKSLNYAIISYYGNTVATTTPVYSGIQQSGVYTTPDLSFNTKYTFTITPYNITGVSGASNTIIIDTTPYVAGVYSTYSTASNTQIQWYGTYSYAKIYRRISAPFSTPYIDLSASTNPYNDINLFGNTTYNYFVRPFDANDNAYMDSSAITVTTNAQAAQDLSAIFFDSSGIMISFTAPKNSYSSSYYYQLNAVYSGSTTSTIGTSSPLLVNGLLDGTTYSCYILSYLDNVLGAKSDSINITLNNIFGTTIVRTIYIPTSVTTFNILTANSFDISLSLNNYYSYTYGHYDLSCSSAANRPANGFEAFRAANNYNGSFFWASAYAANGNQGYTLYPYKSTGEYQGGGLASNTYNTVIGGTAISGEWIQYKLPYLLNITSYEIMYNATNRITSNYYIAGSNDGNTWNLVDSSSSNSTQNIKKTISSASNKYSYYRLVMNKQYPTADGIAGVNYWNIYGYISSKLLDTTNMNPLDTDPTLLVWIKAKTGDYNSSTGDITNYSTTVNTPITSTTKLMTTNGSTISTTTYKFGTSSLYNYNANSGVYCTLNLPTQNWCYSFWWNPDRYVGVNGNTVYQVLLCIGALDYGIWNAGTPPPKNPTIFQWVGGSQAGSPTLSYNFALNTWYHVLINTNANVCSWYVNNTFCISGNNPFYNIVNNTSKFLSLTGQSNSQYVPGYFSDIRYYGRTLTTSDISSLYYYTNSNY